MLQPGVFFEHNQYIIIRSRDGGEVGFGSIAEFCAYTRLPQGAVEAFDYVDYRPDEGVHTYALTSAPSAFLQGKIPNAQLEKLMDNAAVYAERVSNPFFLLNLTQAKLWAKAQIKARAYPWLMEREISNFELILPLYGLPGYPFDDYKDRLLAIRNYIIDRFQAINAASTKAEIEAIFNGLQNPLPA